MAPTTSRFQDNNRNSTRNRARQQKPPIGLDRPKQEEKGKEYFEIIKCRTNPSSASSLTYEIPMRYFDRGSPEEWLTYKDKLEKCFTGQNLTNGPAKYALCRRLLQGQALTSFDNAAQFRTGGTNIHFGECLAAVALVVEEQMLGQQ